jgi:pimeloyl-ACP methyl ester carboxylesterase
MIRLSDMLLLLAETASAVELPRLLWQSPELLRQPAGHGEPVIVLPGFAADDRSTLILRSYLGLLGYRVNGWGFGINRGDITGDTSRVMDTVRRLADENGQRVRLIGWSLGGVIAREVAREEPDMVERVITLGSPVCGGYKYTAARYWYSLTRFDLEADAAEIDERNRVLLRVPVTAICASWDGIVSRKASFDPYSKIEHLEVGTTHIGLGMNADVYRIIAQRLAIPTARPRRYTRPATTVPGRTAALQKTG